MPSENTEENTESEYFERIIASLLQRKQTNEIKKKQKTKKKKTPKKLNKIQ